MPSELSFRKHLGNIREYLFKYKVMNKQKLVNTYELVVSDFYQKHIKNNYGGYRIFSPYKYGNDVYLNGADGNKA